jgi:hypothetical protein
MTFLPRALSLIPPCLQRGRQVCCSSVVLSPLLSKRTFFASSTDHTTLLSESQVFRLPQQEDGILLYALAAGGSDADIVRKVPQLHLARLFVDSEHIWGAKVVNRTLGSLPHVCDKLVDAALQDLNRPVLAKSTLHGLSDWVLTVMDNKESSAVVQSLDPETLEAVTAVAQNKASAPYPKDAWEILAKEFLRHSSEGESALYRAKGATLVEIQHQVDTTEFSDTCAGAMALFEFK